MPLGREGMMPSGRLMFLTTASQKQRGHSSMRLREVGERMKGMCISLRGMFINVSLVVGKSSCVCG